MINKNFNDKWIQKFINLLQGFFYAQYCPFGQEDERKIEQEICNLLKEYLEFLNMGRSEEERKLVEFKNTLPVLKQLVISDMIAAYEGDPAAKSYMEIIIAYPGPLAVLVQRTAHCLYELDIPILPRAMTEYAHSKTAIDIHPGASIGDRFFIDHGTGIVIGETAIIGKRVRIYQGVTLGALSIEDGKVLKGVKRHPTVEDDVVIYAGATILCGNTIIGQKIIIGGNTWITESILPYSKVIVKEKIYQLSTRKK